MPPSSRPLTAWELVWRRCALRWEALRPCLERSTGWKVWNPGLYGEPWHSRFCRLYAPAARPFVLLGLNPGPYGMAQTGIPFTDIRRLVLALPALAAELRDTGERLEVPGLAPASLRPYLNRTFESSSVRVYRFLERSWGDAERAWRKVVVANPCPLLFIDKETGKNRTPADLRPTLARLAGGRAKQNDLLADFDRLRRLSAAEVLEVLRPRGAVLLGRDVESSLGPLAIRILGERRVLAWEHPARAVPNKWATGLLEALRRRGLASVGADSRRPRLGSHRG